MQPTPILSADTLEIVRKNAPALGVDRYDEFTPPPPSTEALCLWELFQKTIRDILRDGRPLMPQMLVTYTTGKLDLVVLDPQLDPFRVAMSVMSGHDIAGKSEPRQLQSLVMCLPTTECATDHECQILLYTAPATPPDCRKAWAPHVCVGHAWYQDDMHVHWAHKDLWLATLLQCVLSHRSTGVEWVTQK